MTVFTYTCAKNIFLEWIYLSDVFVCMPIIIFIYKDDYNQIVFLIYYMCV